MLETTIEVETNNTKSVSIIDIIIKTEQEVALQQILNLKYTVPQSSNFQKYSFIIGFQDRFADFFKF